MSNMLIYSPCLDHRVLGKRRCWIFLQGEHHPRMLFAATFV